MVIMQIDSEGRRNMAGIDVVTGDLRKMEVTMSDGKGDKIRVIIEAPQNCVMGGNIKI